MAEEAQIDGLTETENQFFESGGEVEPESTADEQTEQTHEQEQETAQEDSQQEQVKEQEQQQEKMVPLAALHEERHRRREMQQRLDTMENRFQQVMEKLETRNEPPAPDFDEEPLEAIRHTQEQLAKQLQQQNENLSQQEQQRQQQEYQKTLINHYQQDAARFTQNTPDFMDAYQHLYNSRTTELAAYGYSQDQIGQIMQNEELQLVNNAVQNEMSPAEIIYNAAKARGYTTQQKSTETQQEQQGKKTEEEKFAMAQKGQEASKSLSNSGGKSEKDISLEALADMEDEEFDKMWEKLIGG